MARTLVLLMCACLFVVVCSERDVPGEKLDENISKFLASPEHQERLKSLHESMKNATRSGQTAILNDYTEDLLARLNVFIILEGFDPYELPNMENSFEWKIWPFTYKGVMYLKDGWLQGLGTVSRTGDVTVWYEYPNVKISMPLGFDTLLFDYQYKAKFMGLGPSGGVDGRSTGSRYTVDIYLNMITLNAKLNRFKVNSSGKLSLKFNGSILTDWITNIFVSVSIPFVKPVINLIVETFVSSGLKTIISVYNDVICDLLGNCNV